MAFRSFGEGDAKLPAVGDVGELTRKVCEEAIRSVAEIPME